jgi:hypothetical protein
MQNSSGRKVHGMTRSRMISLRSGGWVLALSALLVAAAVAWRFHDMLAGHGSRAIGDGKHPATYGFELAPSLIPVDRIVASGLPRDGIPVLDLPALMTASEVDSISRNHRTRYLVPDDRVIGVILGGAARAYPLRVLAWHEVVNDTLGGRAIAVTFSPLCDAAAVFDRAYGRDTLGFGHSGLLYNSGLLMYDRRGPMKPAGNAAGPHPGGESLWSQLQCRAVTGAAAAAGESLTVIPCALVGWSDWRHEHPGTTVLAWNRDRADAYARDPYASYQGSDLLRFPVDPLPPRDQMPYKTPCVAVRFTGAWCVYPLPWIASRSLEEKQRAAALSGGGGALWTTVQDGRALRFHYRSAPPTVQVETAPGESPSIVYSFWFAWYSSHSGDWEISRHG